MKIRYLVLDVDNAGDETLTIISEDDFEKIRKSTDGLSGAVSDKMSIIDLVNQMEIYKYYNTKTKTWCLGSKSIKMCTNESMLVK